MPDIELKNIPQPLYARLEQEAKNHGWPVDREALNCLAIYFSTDQKRAEKTLEDIRQVRARLAGIHVTDESLRQAREEGRS
jgi:hypothetical protein